MRFAVKRSGPECAAISDRMSRRSAALACRRRSACAARVASAFAPISAALGMGYQPNVWKRLFKLSPTP